MAAAIVGDDAIAMLAEKKHLGVPGIGAKGQPCEKVTTGFPAAPILVVDRGSIFRGEVFIFS